ncbi:helix-turn-helix domain-containing protein [Paenibacillus tritici]|uniref:Helix-turn-helix domain-containing protein n=1 Tax=Paenibacillus tritici TaxID=1873425 RepID=A0ABX2DI57_9BACL|nr:helix-turn-helix transcriptional regulator [Paenibacillus tritici]NQX44304.1 helix-turn-helix domain-containing protein [Paenibacillus tritici]QUL57914.1 helix-turn-helix domain-containing protein [Paenibacillus tritici]
MNNNPDGDHKMLVSHKAKTLGAFLKSRRERLSPKDVGLSIHNGQRKTPGLRREEVSLLAGVSVTYYTWLEQGRELTASREVMQSIAEALQLSADEKNHLFELWNPHTSNPPLPLAAPDFVNPQMQLIIDQIEYPSYITNERSEILAWNEAAGEMIADFASIAAEDRYFIRLLFNNMDIRRRIVNIEEFSSYAVSVFRTYYDKHKGDPWYEETVKELTGSSREFNQIWKSYDIQLKKVQRITLQSLDIPKYVTYDINSLLDLSGSPDIHICVYTPVLEGNADR